MGQHVAGADRDDAEGRFGADQGGRYLPDGAVAAGGDDRIIAWRLGGLRAASRAAARSAGGGAGDGCAALLEHVHGSSTSGDADHAGAWIGDEEEAAAHVRADVEARDCDTGL